ncbi:cbb3-type cytochrome c oxidase subunit I [Pseudogemmobacter faecipullorum]|uniref:Cytochrome-c oxidase n=1 Tax=Pseudogemmobacter faecipullorum TaxID=2755041 RepID=A0ABS8CP33_9RHOB|nr:cbb3-type cytochrome c oxidase subunit I [Pseudogemmobacter faecipullorum]MCB5411157.1 hypothetical protein [Pseudogemmobacter faecipullorum]
MRVAKGFLVTGAFWLVIGFLIGIIMGAMGDHSLMPLHAHMNLIGFTLMTGFGLGYALLPDLHPGLARAHYWLHQAGTLVMMIGLYLKYAMDHPLAKPLLVPGSFLILAGAILWLINLLRLKISAPG